MEANTYSFIYTVTSRALGRARYHRGTMVVSEFTYSLLPNYYLEISTQKKKYDIIQVIFLLITSCMLHDRQCLL